MVHRVIPFARARGYVWYDGASRQLSREARLAHNAAQIRQWMAEGRIIIDLGSAGISTPSANYEMEQAMLRGYPYRVRDRIREFIEFDGLAA